MTLYAKRYSPGSTSLEDAEVVDESRYGWSFLDQAIALWRLVDPRRANAIAAIREQASNAPSDHTQFAGEELAELLRLVTGVTEAIVATGIVDQEWRVPAESLEELERKVPGMDLTTERPLDCKVFALGEVMSNALSLRNFLSNALSAGCIVVHD
jgi:hypothetical protein